MKKTVAYLLVLIQFSCLIYILITGPFITNTIHGLLMQFSGMFLGIQAIYTMGIGNFNVAPLARTDGKFINHGIYSVIRHPMYFALLLALTALVVDYYNWQRMIVLFILVVTLLFKLHFEERELVNHFSEYKDYMQRTHRLIPFIY